MTKPYTTCPRCSGAGQLDTIKKIVMHADQKNCTYWQDRETCRQCDGKGRVQTHTIPTTLRGLTKKIGQGVNQ